MGFFLNIRYIQYSADIKCWDIDLMNRSQIKVASRMKDMRMKVQTWLKAIIQLT